jgi:hypothetical protein
MLRKLLVLILLPLSLFAQSPVLPDPLPSVSETDRAQIELLLAKRQVMELQAELLQKSFNEALARMRTEYAQLLTEIEVKVNATFTKAGVPREGYDLDLKTGQIVKGKVSAPGAPDSQPAKQPDSQPSKAPAPANRPVPEPSAPKP